MTTKEIVVPNTAPRTAGVPGQETASQAEIIRFMEMMYSSGCFKGFNRGITTVSFDSVVGTYEIYIVYMNIYDIIYIYTYLIYTYVFYYLCSYMVNGQFHEYHSCRLVFLKF